MTEQAPGKALHAAPETTPGQAAYAVGDRVCVTGTVIGVNTRADWISVRCGNAVFAVNDASVNSDLSPAAAQERPAPAPECRASQSGNCLQLTHGFAACRPGECIDGMRPKLAINFDEEVTEERAAEIRQALDTAVRNLKPQPAPALPADPSADDLAIASLTDQLTEARALLAVTAAERNDLRQALDERNAQHKQLLEEFELIDGLDGYQHGVAVLEATDLARAYTDAGYPVRDDLSHLTGQRQTAAPGAPTTEEP